MNACIRGAALTALQVFSSPVASDCPDLLRLVRHREALEQTRDDETGGLESPGLRASDSTGSRLCCDYKL